MTFHHNTTMRPLVARLFHLLRGLSLAVCLREPCSSLGITRWNSIRSENTSCERSADRSYARIGKTFGLGLALLAATASTAADETPNPLEQLSEAATTSRLALDYDGETFSGPGYERLLEEGRAAHFFLVGEEHGIAENPKLLAQLFGDLADYGYRRLAIEISPPMARTLDTVLLNGGLDGLRALYAMPGGEPAFFGMLEEAEMLAEIRAAVPDDEPVFWGTDYEVAGDRTLLRELSASNPPESAQELLSTLIAASDSSWQQWAETGKPQYIFSFSADPALVAELRAAWPDRSEAVDSILNSLEETFAINQLWVEGNGYLSNVRRGALMRRNFLDHWQALDANKEKPRVMAKYGSSHVVRGLNMTRTFDIGALVHELAPIEGLQAVSVIVLPGPESLTAVLDPTHWQFVAAPAKDGYADGLEPLVEAAFDDRFTLIDLRPLRRKATARSTGAHENLVRIVAGFDYLLVMSGSSAAGELDHN